MHFHYIFLVDLRRPQICEARIRRPCDPVPHLVFVDRLHHEAGSGYLPNSPRASEFSRWCSGPSESTASWRMRCRAVPTRSVLRHEQRAGIAQGRCVSKFLELLAETSGARGTGRGVRDRTTDGTKISEHKLEASTKSEKGQLSPSERGRPTGPASSDCQN